ncbi:uncharacterized protein LOC143292016 [Babylonia areolata]|uniref:uncharacterized protein LOC143292016 n=1 Tax=Babylonia areolata TaxID=304850 RepID=UPI003FD3264D
MAMSLSGHRLGNRRHLICGICREVYRSPRLLPCHHSFCLDCIEGLIKTRPNHSQYFPCPQCRKPVPVSRNGALGFQLNFHIPEEDLELERNGPQKTPCPHHSEEPLLFFCVPCDQPICLRCKLTKHDHHETQDLSEAADRCSSRLEQLKNRLEAAINRLSQVSAVENNNAKDLELKEKALIQEVQAQRDDIVTKVDRLCNEVNRNIRERTKSIRTQLTQDAHAITVQQRRDSLLQLRQRVNHALSSQSEAEKVYIEKEMREGEGSEEELGKIMASVPSTTLRPGVRRDLSLFTDDTIRRWLGSAVCLSLPFAATASEIITPIFQCGQDGSCREVHTLYPFDDIVHVSFGGIAPHYDEELAAIINVNGELQSSDCLKKGKVFFKGDSDTSYVYVRCQPSNETIQLGCKSSHYIAVKYTETNTYCSVVEKIVISRYALEAENKYMFNVDCEKPIAFDVTEDREFFVIIESKTSEDSQLNIILLFRHGERQPFTTYTPPVKHFQPADVCFWTEGGKLKLLIANTDNDNIHVVRVENNRCYFERCLASGDDNIVRPTALSVDNEGNVWIGCRNGWVLTCKRPPVVSENEESQNTDEDSETFTGS